MDDEFKQSRLRYLEDYKQIMAIKIGDAINKKIQELIKIKKEVTDEILVHLVGGLKEKHYRRVSGEDMTWKVIGNERTLLVQDRGNGWYIIIELIDENEKR